MFLGFELGPDDEVLLNGMLDPNDGISEGVELGFLLGIVDGDCDGKELG